MDDDYIRLSFTVGWLMKEWDTILGRSHFVPKGFELRWALSWELLEQLKKEAIELGVPKESTELPEQSKKLFNDSCFYAVARLMQARRDSAMGFPSKN